MSGAYSKGAFGELNFFSSYVCLSAQNWKGLLIGKVLKLINVRKGCFKESFIADIKY